MTYDQYWHGSAEVAAYYRKAYLLKQKERNHEFWLQGMYIYEALLDVAPVMTAFRGKNAKPSPYSEEPYPITAQEVMERKERKARQEQEKLRAALEAWAKKTNEYFASKKDQSPLEVNDTDG